MSKEYDLIDTTFDLTFENWVGTQQEEKYEKEM